MAKYDKWLPGQSPIEKWRAANPNWKEKVGQPKKERPPKKRPGRPRKPKIDRLGIKAQVNAERANLNLPPIKNFNLIQSGSILTHEEQRKKISDDFLYIYSHLDFKLFCSYLNVYTKDSRSPIKSFAYENWYQEQKTFEANRTGRDIVLKPRQIGTSTLELARDLFYALTHEGSKVIVCAHDNETKLSLMNDLKVFLDCLKDLKSKYQINHILPDEIPVNNTTTINFADIGSWIYFISAGETIQQAASKGRGKSASRLHLTEFAYWQVPAETLGSIMASAIDDFECVIESTANGINNLFHEMYENAKAGRNGFKAHFFSWIDHQRYSMVVYENDVLTPSNDWETMFVQRYQITPEQLKWWKDKCSVSGLEKMLSEYPVDDFSAFRNKNTNRFLSWEEEKWLSEIIIAPIAVKKIFDVWNLDVYQEPQDKSKYVLSADPAGGTGNDFSVMYIFEKITWKLCACFANNTIAPYDFGDLIEFVGRQYNNAEIIWETNNHGIAVTDKLIKLQYPNCYSGVFSPSNKLGFATNVRSRSSLMGLLVELIRKRLIDGIDGMLANELKNFGYKDDKLEGLNGIHDDHVMAWIIGMKLLEVEGMNKSKSNFQFRWQTGRKRDFQKKSNSPF